MPLFPLSSTKPSIIYDKLAWSSRSLPPVEYRNYKCCSLVLLFWVYLFISLILIKTKPNHTCLSSPWFILGSEKHSISPWGHEQNDLNPGRCDRPVSRNPGTEPRKGVDSQRLVWSNAVFRVIINYSWHGYLMPRAVCQPKPSLPSQRMKPRVLIYQTRDSESPGGRGGGVYWNGQIMIP